VSKSTVLYPAIGARGDAVLAWTEGAEVGHPLFTALRRPHRRFGGPVRTISAAIFFHLAAGDDGTIALATDRAARSHAIVTAFVAGPRARRFARGQRLGCRGGVAGDAVAPDGHVVVACTHSQAGDLEVWEGSSRLKRTATVATGFYDGDQGSPVDVDAGGRVLLAWEQATTHGGDEYSSSRAVAAYRPAPGAPFTTAVITPDHEGVTPRVARLLPGGGALVLSETFDSGPTAEGGGRILLGSRLMP
jgi:hypothetical protein